MVSTRQFVSRVWKSVQRGDLSRTKAQAMIRGKKMAVKARQKRSGAELKLLLGFQNKLSRKKKR